MVIRPSCCLPNLSLVLLGSGGLSAAKCAVFWWTGSWGQRPSTTVKPVSRNHITSIFWWNRIPWIICRSDFTGHVKGRRALGRSPLPNLPLIHTVRIKTELVFFWFFITSSLMNRPHTWARTKTFVSLKKNPKLWNLSTFFQIPPPKHLNSNKAPRGCLWAAPPCVHWWLTYVFFWFKSAVLFIYHNK